MKTILWTGGFDSTALVLNALNEKEKFSTLSIAIGNNPDQAESEKRARSRIQKYLRLEYPDSAWYDHVEHKFPTIDKNHTVSYVQPIIWLTLPMLTASEGIVEIGWVRGDDVWHHKHDVQTVFDAAVRLTRSDGVSGHSKLTLGMPLEWATKNELLGFYERVTNPLALMSMLSVNECGDDWMTAKCPKSQVMRDLWDEMFQRLSARKTIDVPMSGPLQLVMKTMPTEVVSSH